MKILNLGVYELKDILEICFVQHILIPIIAKLLDALSIGTGTNFVLECLKTTYGVNLFQKRIGFRWFDLNFKL